MTYILFFNRRNILTSVGNPTFQALRFIRALSILAYPTIYSGRMIHVPGEDHSYVLYIVHKPNFSTDCTVDTAISGYIRTLSMRYRIRKIGLQQTVLFFCSVLVENTLHID